MTCGECKRFSVCSDPRVWVPMLIVQVHPAETTTDATLCPCFERKEEK